MWGVRHPSFDKLLVVLAFTVRGGGLPPSGESLRVSCEAGSDQCRVVLSLVDAGNFEATLERSEALKRIEAAREALATVAVARTVPSDAILEEAELTEPSRARVSRFWVAASPDAGAPSGIERLRGLRQELRRLALKTPSQTAALSCEGKRTGRRLVLECAVKNTGTREFEIAPPGPARLSLVGATGARLAVDEVDAAPAKAIAPDASYRFSLTGTAGDGAGVLPRAVRVNLDLLTANARGLRVYLTSNRVVLP